MNNMNEKMLAALKQETSNKLPKELEIATAAHKRELAEAKERHRVAVRGLEQRARELEAENRALLSGGEQAKARAEVREKEWRLKVEEAARRSREAEWKMARAQEENKKVVQVANKSVEKVKEEYNRKLNEMKNKCEQSILKFKQEKTLLEERLKKAETELKKESAKCINEVLSLIHICRCRRIERCRSRWSPYH
eukprot:TRINITY_DN3884_c0_g1_i3.p2 TRINITY_DN3884_c0_g1~~TRINITY_DN3884_c0_g1_i3.p2  ORF type:complete len:195 (-),score=90.57 TRINITY_DN3884_c0_g1_i3:18-602(-)